MYVSRTVSTKINLAYSVVCKDLYHLIICRAHFSWLYHCLVIIDVEFWDDFIRVISHLISNLLWRDYDKAEKEYVICELFVFWGMNFDLYFNMEISD